MRAEDVVCSVSTGGAGDSVGVEGAASAFNSEGRSGSGD